MNKENKSDRGYYRWTSVLLVCLSFIFMGIGYGTYWIHGFSGMFLWLVNVPVGFILFILTMRRLISLFYTRNLRLLPSFSIAVIALILIIIRPVERTNEYLKSQVKWSGYCEHTVTSLGIILRQDHSFEYTGGRFMDTKMYTGKYEERGDTFILHFNQEPVVPHKDTLVLKDPYLVETGDSNQHLHHFKPNEK